MKYPDYPRSQLEHLIDEWIIGKNSIRDKEILKLALLDGISQERIAEQFGLSTRQVQNIIYKTQERLFKHL
jgi:DNA-directed RNA polymerase specialized sigma24 family protein